MARHAVEELFETTCPHCGQVRNLGTNYCPYCRLDDRGNSPEMNASRDQAASNQRIERMTENGMEWIRHTAHLNWFQRFLFGLVMLICWVAGAICMIGGTGLGILEWYRGGSPTTYLVGGMLVGAAFGLLGHYVFYRAGPGT